MQTTPLATPVTPQSPSFVGITAQNSIAFVQAVFDCLARKQPLVVLKERRGSEQQYGLNINEYMEPPVTTGWAELSFSPISSDDVAQIAFTSGTEGTPKGILITHANLADMVDRLNSVMRMDSSIREYVGVPVYHSFGFGRCRAVATLGGAIYIPKNGFDPLEIKHLLDAKQINAISAVPSLWRVLFGCEELFGSETARIRWIEIGSQYMSAEEKLRLKRLFPNAIIVQHYGLTEASRATFLEIHNEEAPERLESVGRPVGDSEIRITIDGRIAIRGSLVAGQCLKNGVQEGLLDNGGWLITSDLGEIVDSYLFYQGRADDIINCGGIKLAPEDIENRLRALLQINDGIACCRIPDEVRGHSILLAYKQSVADPGKLEAAATNVLAQMHVNLGSSLRLMEVDSFPVTATGKIKRKDLAEAFLAYQRHTTPPKNDPEVALDVRPPTPREQELLELWRVLLAVESVSLDASFQDLGGDSLSAISAMVKMKRLGIAEETCRGILQGKTISEIVASEQNNLPVAAKRPDLSCPSAESIKNALNIKFVRGLLVLFVIAAHWSVGLFERLPESFQWLRDVFAPIFSFGTPGFAILYGVAMGYSVYPLYLQSPARIKRLIGPMVVIIFLGLVMLAGARILLQYLTAGEITLTQVTSSFYSVLSYYLLATLSLSAWFWLLKRSCAPVITALACALLLHLFYLQFMYPLGGIPAEGFTELGKLLISAKYSYFNMSSGVFVGLALGIAMSTPAPQHFTLRSPAALALALMAVVAAWWLSELTDNASSWSQWPVGMVAGWRWLFYIGVSLLLLVGVNRLLNYYHKLARPAYWWINIIACFGFLAFPMFVSHELVLPLKSLLEVAGLPNGVAVLIALGSFAVFTSYLLYKTYRLQSV